MNTKTSIPLPKLSKVAGVELVRSDSGVELFVVVLEQQKGQVSISNNFQPDSLETLKEEIGNLPIFLSLNGKGILHRSIAKTKGSAESILRQVLPQSNISEFYVQPFEGAENTLVSLCRRPLVDDWLAKFLAADLVIIGLNLGTFSLSGLGGLFGEEQLLTNTMVLRFSGDNITDFEPISVRNSSFISFGEEQLETALVPAFSNAFAAFLGREGLAQAAVLKQREVFNFKQKFKTYGLGFLAVLLVLLLVNGLYFQHYFSSNQELSAELSVKQGQLQELSTLQQQMKENEAFFAEGILAENSRVSFYADRLAHSLDKSDIQLVSLNIFPKIEEKNRENRPPMFRQKELLLSGKTKNCLAVNRWNESLKQLKWLASSKILNCGENESGTIHFELLIAIK